MGLRDVATIDIGGTSSDMGVISDGLARTVDQSAVEGWPIMAPTIEILAIGGGGSIAWVDTGGALRVGPQSAGARPGPASYGLGGTAPTVYDACVILNRLNPDYFLAGEMTLDRDAAERAIREHIAEPLGMDIADAAECILRVVTANMNKAIRSILIARGFGMIGAIELAADKASRTRFDPDLKLGIRCRDHCIEKGVIIRAVRDIMVLAPPLIVTEEQIDRIVETARSALDTVARDLQQAA